MHSKKKNLSYPSSFSSSSHLWFCLSSCIRTKEDDVIFNGQTEEPRQIFNARISWYIEWFKVGIAVRCISRHLFFVSRMRGTLQML